MKIECIFCYPDKDLIIYSFNSFFLVIDPFPVCKGHMLIISKEHYGCLAEMPLEKINECQSIIDFLKEEFVDYICYEHGRAGVCIKNSNGFSCDHMHLHFLPIYQDMHLTLSKNYSSTKINNLNELSDIFHGYGSYLFFSNKNISYAYPIVNQNTPPHLLRSISANLLNNNKVSNWENYKDFELQKSNQEFKKILKLKCNLCNTHI